MSLVAITESYGVDDAKIQAILTDPRTPDGTDRGAYAAGTAYAINDIVTDVGIRYIGLQAANTGHTPATSPTYWAVIPVATFGPMIDIPTIKVVTLTGTVKEEDLRGDRQLKDSRAVLQSLAVAWNHGELSFDALAAQLGGSSTVTGTLGDQTATYKLRGTDKTLPPFRFEAQALVGPDEESDTHFVLHKCRGNAFPGIAFADEAFHIFTGSAKVVPMRSTQDWFDIVANENAKAIVAAA